MIAPTAPTIENFMKRDSSFGLVWYMLLIVSSIGTIIPLTGCSDK